MRSRWRAMMPIGMDGSFCCCFLEILEVLSLLRYIWGDGRLGFVPTLKCLAVINPSKAYRCRIMLFFV